MSLQIWMPLNKNLNKLPDITSFGKESGISLTADSDGYYKIQDSSHVSSRWGIYYNLPVKANTSYTLYVYSKSPSGNTANLCVAAYNHSGLISWPAAVDTNTSSTEKYTAYTFTTSNTATVARVYLSVTCTATTANNYILVKEPKLIEAPENQGLSDVTVTSNNYTVNNNGKFGKCIKTKNTTGLDLKYDGNQINTGSISFGGWFKFNKNEIGEVINNARTYDSTYNTPTGQLIGNDSYGGIGIVWNSNNMYTSSPFSSLLICSNIRTSTVNRTTGSYTVVFDTWVHIFVTFNKDTGALTLYINGSKFSETIFSSFSDARSYNLMLNYAGVYGGNGPGLYIPFDCNDIRVYDHALSELEIKRISQGLACHYNLSDGTAESTTNIITTEDCLSSTCYNGATSKYGYGTTTDMYKTVTTFDGKKGTKVYMGTNGNPAFPYVYIDNMYTSNGGSYPLDRTLSFDYYSTISTSIRPYKLGSGSGTATYRVQNASTGISTGTGTDAVMIPVKPNMWNHIEITFHNTTTDSAQWGYIQNYPSHTSDTSNFWFFANMQLENKDHATAYAGVGGTRTSTTIYDTSGYCNNGIINGDLTTSTDAPKYQASIYMPTAATISHSRCLDNTNQEWTCAAWVKLDGTTANQQLNNFNYANRIMHNANGTPLLYLNAGTDDYYIYGNKVVPTNTWTHIAFVFKNSTGERNIYINGVLQNGSGPNKTSTPVGIPDIIDIGINFAGYICDYREYATALSADDVKSLYQNEAQLDTSGNVLGPIR